MSGRILVVEDQVSQASAIARTLTANGYEVRIAADGRAGVDAAVEWLPDAVLMDVRMPVMNGLVACARIRSHPRTRKVPVVAITARARPEDFLHGLLAGFNKYLTKPYSNRELLEVVSELLRRADQRAKIEALAPARRELDALLHVVGGREQIFTGLLAALRPVVDCDLLALQWSAGGPANLLVTTRFSETPDELVADVRAALGIPAAEEPNTLAIGGGDAPWSGARVRAGVEVPLCQGGDCLGVLYVASVARDHFEPGEERSLAALSSSLARVCAAGLDIGTVAEPDAHTLVHEIDVMVVAEDPASAAAWARRAAAAVSGLRLHPAGDIPQPAAGEPDYHLALVTPPLRDRAEQAMFARARAGARAFPLLDLGPADLAIADRDLPAMLFMQLLIAFMDARRSGCLHVGTADGSQAPGLIVFHEGRIAWASGVRNDTSLMDLLARQSGVSREALRDAVCASGRERRGLAEVLVERGLIAPATLRAALKDYIVAALGELVNVERPRLLYSRQVVATPHNESFAVDDITIEMFSP